MKIYCPKCRWEPDPGDRWACTCGHVWNTFNTRGVCPRCGKQWQYTQCLACHQWSRHADWYHDDDAAADKLDIFREFIDDLEIEEEEPVETPPAPRSRNSVFRSR